MFYFCDHGRSLPRHAPANAQSSDPLVVEADDSLEWRREDRQYIATGNAVATQGETTLKAMSSPPITVMMQSTKPKTSISPALSAPVQPC